MPFPARRPRDRLETRTVGVYDGEDVEVELIDKSRDILIGAILGQKLPRMVFRHLLVSEQ